MTKKSSAFCKNTPRILSRRNFLRDSAGIVATTALATSALPLSGRSVFAAESIATTTAGSVRGTAIEGVHVFKGIPYGASTAGANRFMPPKPAEPWTGVRNALDYGPSAPQGPGLAAPSNNEDCLVLNVWTRGLNDSGKRPVMVWLHGGGFTAGSGASAIYDGARLCQGGDVVVVTLNHRLNIFSTCFLGDIIGDEFAYSGCVGMLDIIAALEWVRDNIEQFGGDPDNVMIFGESGGGRKTSLLLAMPDARGLFHRAIIQSGAILRVVPREDGTRATRMLLDELGIAEKDARKLQQVPVDQLRSAYGQVAAKFRLREPVVGLAPSTPILDGEAIPAHPFDPAAPEFSKNVPVMVGYNRTEETIYYRSRTAPTDMTEDELKQRAVERLGDTSVPIDRVLAAYRTAWPDASPWERYMLICTDHPRGTYPQTLAVRRDAAGSAPTYLYRFDWEINDTLMAPHALEIPFAFDNLHQDYLLFDIPESSEARSLAKRMSEAWIAFARTGNPSTANLPQWAPYTAKERHTMLFNNACRVVKDPAHEARVVMEKVLGLA